MDQSIIQTSVKNLESIKILIQNKNITTSTANLRSEVEYLRCLLTSGKCESAKAISILILLAKSRVSFDFLRSVLDEDLIFSLASNPAFVIRSRILDLLLVNTNDESNGLLLLKPRVLFGLFFELSNDLYPSGRISSIDGLVALCKRDDQDMVKLMFTAGVYEKTILLLKDEDVMVRVASIRLLSEWGKMLVKNPAMGLNVQKMSDEIFILICTMTRDMDAKVRIEAFTALGKVKLVSESMLLQSLSKKVLVNRKGVKGAIAEYTKLSIKGSNCSLSSAAGAFIHGLEDEFHEVRTAASFALGMLTVFSIPFTSGVLNLLMDMLNDDAMVVKMQTFKIFLNISQYDQLKVQEIHMPMFLGMLSDTNASIRHAARKVLCNIMLPNMELFKSSIYTLLTNLETYPQDEEDILSVLFCVGRGHVAFASQFLECIEELKPSTKGKMKLDSCRVAAFSVLAISTHLSCEKGKQNIPDTMFSYALPLLGKISNSLRNFVNQDYLFCYLCRHSVIHCLMENWDYEEEWMEKLQNLPKESCLMVHPPSNIRSQIHSTPETCVKEDIEKSLHAFDILQLQPQMTILNDEAAHSIFLILEVVAGVWSSVQLQHQHGPLSTLRACQEELEMMGGNGSGNPAMIFVSQYIETIRLLLQAWSQLVPRKFNVIGMQNLDIILSNLDIALIGMRYSFPGLSKEEEIHLLELGLLCCVARLFRIGICSQSLLRRINATICRIEHLCGENLPIMSNFVKEAKHLFFQEGKNESCKPFFVSGLFSHFSLERLQFSGKFDHIKAELEVKGNDSENPINFFPKLPVGIPFQITLYGVSKNDRIRIWIKMIVGGFSTQHSFIDSSKFNQVSNKLSFYRANVSFYGSPNVASFVMKAHVVMECPFEHDDFYMRKKSKTGPKHMTTSLSKVKDIYLVNVKKKEFDSCR